MNIRKMQPDRDTALFVAYKIEEHQGGNRYEKISIDAQPIS